MTTVVLLRGECLLARSAAGTCSVCRQPLAPGPAVQNKWCGRIRHVDCLPVLRKDWKKSSTRTA